MVRSRGILIQKAMHVVVRQQASNSLLSIPSQAPTGRATQPQWPLPACLALANGPSGPMSPRLTCMLLAQSPPKSVTTLSRMLRYPARRGRLPRAPNKAKTRVSSAPENFPMCKTHSMTHTHMACRDVSIHIETNTRDFSRSLRGPLHRTTWSCCGVAILLSVPLIKHRLVTSRCRNFTSVRRAA